jgi:hypothetical protein
VARAAFVTIAPRAVAHPFGRSWLRRCGGSVPPRRAASRTSASARSQTRRARAGADAFPLLLVRLREADKAMWSSRDVGRGPRIGGSGHRIGFLDRAVSGASADGDSVEARSLGVHCGYVTACCTRSSTPFTPRPGPNGTRAPLMAGGLTIRARGGRLLAEGGQISVLALPMEEASKRSHDRTRRGR